MKLHRLAAAALFALLPVAAWAQSYPGTTTGVQRANLGVIAHVPTVAALKALSLTGIAAGAAVSRDGYYVAGDAPAVTYTLSTSPCTLNSGGGDGGSQIPSNTTGNCWLLGKLTALDPRAWGAVPGGTDPNSNNATQINALLAYAGTIGSGGEVDVNGAGMTYGVNGPVDIAQNGILFENTSLIALSAAALDPTTSGVLSIITGASQVDVRNVNIDAGRLPVCGMYITQPGHITIGPSVNVQHWTKGATAAQDGCGFKFASKASVTMFRTTAQQWLASDSEANVLGDRAGYGYWWQDTSGGSFGYNIQAQYGLAPFKMGDSVSSIRLISPFFFSGCGSTGCSDNGGQPQTDPACIVMDGSSSDLEISNGTFDECNLQYNNSLGIPILWIGAGLRQIYSSAAASFTSNFGNAHGNWIVVNTTTANTSFGRIQTDVSTNGSSGGPATIALTQSGSGSWTFDSTTLSSDQLTALAGSPGNISLPGATQQSGGAVSTLTGYLNASQAISTTSTLGSSFCGFSIYFNNAAAAVTETLSAGAPPGCRIGLAAHAANTVTLSAGTGASLNGTSGGTKALTQNQACYVESWRNTDGASAEWFTVGC